MNRNQLANKSALYALGKIERAARIVTQYTNYINKLTKLEGVELNDRFNEDFNKILGKMNETEETLKQRKAGLAMMKKEGEKPRPEKKKERRK